MTLTIGEVAKQTGLSPKAIRLYETHGLIPPPRRTQAGYRTYDQHDLALLRFVGQARALDLRLEEIKEILDLQQASGQPCGRVLELLDTHIGGIDRTIGALQQLRATLVHARDAAKESSRRGDQAVVCRLIEAQAPPHPGAHRVAGEHAEVPSALAHDVQPLAPVRDRLCVMP